MKLISSILYNIKQGLKGILSNKTMSFISIGSVSASLIILGIVISIVLNANQFIENTKDEVNEIRVTIPNNLVSSDKDSIQNKIKSIDGIKSVKFETKEEAFNEMKSSWGKDAHLLDGMKNPLDDYFRVTIDNSKDIVKISNQISNINGVTEVNYYQDIMKNFLSLSNTIKKVGSVVIICLFIVCLFMISNTIRARVYSKKEEVKIMRYVGASKGFIRAPFLIEGFAIGIIGALISTVVSVFMYGYVYDNMGENLTFIASGNVLIPTQNIGITLAIVFLLAGTLIGIIGSAVSLRKHLKV
ncbi:MAG: permease-like cell division protein FtsX [Peptostreptococcaceae bacterium]